MNIHDKVVEIICHIIGVPARDIHDNHSMKDLDMDALDRTELAIELEDEFYIDIEEDTITEKSTIADIAYMVGSKL